MTLTQLRASRRTWRLREKAALRRYKDTKLSNDARKAAREEYQHAKDRRAQRDTQIAARQPATGVSERGAELVARFEGGASADGKFRPYTDAVGVRTIGYGHTGPDVERLGVLTKDQALKLLRTDLNRFAVGVARLVHVPLSQNQFDALVSLAYNIGLGAFGGSTLLRKLNAKDYSGAASEFLRWNKGGGRVLKGLTLRRQAERNLYLTK